MCSTLIWMSKEKKKQRTVVSTRLGVLRRRQRVAAAAAQSLTPVGKAGACVTPASPPRSHPTLLRGKFVFLKLVCGSRYNPKLCYLYSLPVLKISWFSFPRKWSRPRSPATLAPLWGGWHHGSGGGLVKLPASLPPPVSQLPVTPSRFVCAL